MGVDKRQRGGSDSGEPDDRVGWTGAVGGATAAGDARVAGPVVGHATLAAVAATLLIAVPTGIVPTAFYTRMTPVQWWNYPVLAASALLLGLTAGTYARPAAASAHAGAAAKASGGGGVLSVFAVGCPICNKLVVLAFGASGALRYFAPVQPLLAIVSLGLLAAALWVRLGGQVACRAAFG